MNPMTLTFIGFTMHYGFRGFEEKVEILIII